MRRKNAWGAYGNTELEMIEKLSREYRTFLDTGKTERECVNETIRIAKEHGYHDLDTIIATGKSLSAGDKVYHAYMGRAIVLYHIGKNPLEQGMNILGAHVDCPRIDIKQIPLYEKKGCVYLDTHYYGGIKKYQWLSTAMALHGVIVKKDGTVVNVSIGEKEEDPVFVITDILPHLGKEQEKKNAGDFVQGEKMDLLIGTKPAEGEEKEAVKEAIMKLLTETYGIEEDDFISAELEIVPAGKARECGLDRSMILGYGQDDRVCAFTSLLALLEMDELDKTGCCLLVDKEEIGSAGATSMTSKFFENSLAELMNCMGDYSELKLRRTLANSHMLSSDVSAGYDPMYEECFEEKNSAFLGNGLVFNKYTGARGKNGTNDANPEYIARLRKMMEENDVVYQTAEIGAVDVGGGGTIAYVMAEYAMNVIDSGIAVLGMHAPYEVTSKADLLEALKGYKVFLLNA